MKRAVFLDKDGTLIEDVPYNADPARITLAPGAYDACAAFHAAGYVLAVVTNQSGVARGMFAEEALQSVANKLRVLLDQPSIVFLYCPHGPGDGCLCRKPQPGLIRRAATVLDLDLARSWMIGDILNDVEAGSRAGCKTVLVDNGGETEWTPGPFRNPDRTVASMAQAATAILYPERLAA